MKINSINSAQQTATLTDKQKRVRNYALLGAATGILSGVLGVYSIAKGKNPAQTFKNLSYSEGDVLLVGLGSVLGGLTGGLIADDDKNNIKPKLREASQQFIGNMVFPIGTLAVGNSLLSKLKLNLPQFKSANNSAKFANNLIKATPKTVVTILSLMCGMELGNKVINKVNNSVFKEEVKHDVKPEDYLVHADDLCLTANMVLKDTKMISKITNKILPWTFIISGTKTGVQEAPKKDEK